MARPLRVEYAGAVYHVMNRGNPRRRVFHDVKFHQLFLDKLAHSAETFGVEVRAYCLMPNYFQHASPHSASEPDSVHAAPADLVYGGRKPVASNIRARLSRAFRIKVSAFGTAQAKFQAALSKDSAVAEQVAAVAQRRAIPAPAHRRETEV